MNEPGWTAPEGWGPPTPSAPPPAPPPSGEPQYGQPQYGQPPDPPRPDVKPGVVPLRPLGLGELLDGAVGVVRRYPRPTLTMSAVIAVVATVVNVGLLLSAFRPFVDPDSAADLQGGDLEALEAALGGVAVGGLLTGLLAVLSGAILTGVVTAVVGKAVLGQPLGLAGVWEQVRPRLLGLLAVAALLGLLAGGLVFAAALVGTLMIAIGGPLLALLGVPLILGGVAAAIYLYIRYSLAPCALVLERLDVRTSLHRSAVLVKGDWWRVFGITGLTFLIAGFISLVVQVPFALLGDGSTAGLTGGGDVLATRALIASSIGSIVAATLVDPFQAGVRALLYVDRRMRAEGLDVALTAAASDRS
ncbi:MAG: hypothetical protein WD794_12165 [Mycobacteriales bacterium]